MENVSHNKGCLYESIQIHVDPPINPLIKIKFGTKQDKDCVNIKLRRNPMFYKSDIYEFIISLFDNWYSDEFLLFRLHYNMTLDMSKTLTLGANIQYI